ncbi:MAG: ribosomal protein [Acidimicrobiales bacterium]|jgi:small subunit ribosomal protein S18|nr:ribosomal protein [Acidimicrobiales bacterium]
MARGGGGNDRDRKRSPKDSRRPGKKKVCIFCKEHIEWVDYKDVNLLRRYMSDRGKIRAQRVSGNCRQHQQEVAVAIKTARELALLPYTQRTMAERGPGRGGRGGRQDAILQAPAPEREAPRLDQPDADVDLDVGPDLVAAGTDIVDEVGVAPDGEA